MLKQQIDQIRSLYFCGDLGNELTSEEIHQVLHIKRFFECIVADPKFREPFYARPEMREELLSSRGIYGLDPDQLVFLAPEDPEARVADESIDQYPLVHLWKKWSDATAEFRSSWSKFGDQAADSSYRKWRARQNNRCESELGSMMNEGLVHALATFELNKGCSMNCPFCGIAAPPLKDVFAYTPDNSKLFRECVQLLTDRFGEAAKTAFCYWATDPADNPDYLRFIKDMGEITGVYPQATTAAPMRDVDWTRDLLDFRRQHTTIADRFSVLSVGTLRKIHETFTAEELAFVELVCIGSTSLQPRTKAGRNRKVDDFSTKSGNVKTAAKKKKQVEPHEGTIACVSGFLINMVDRNVKLISPYASCDKYPLGYRVFAEDGFDTSDDLAKFMDKVSQEQMKEQLDSEIPMVFRPDLEFVPVSDGFHLKNSHFVHKMTGASHMANLGAMVQGANRTAGNIIGELLKQEADLFSVTGSIQHLYDKGLLTDDIDERAVPIQLDKTG